MAPKDCLSAAMNTIKSVAYTRAIKTGALVRYYLMLQKAFWQAWSKMKGVSSFKCLVKG